MNGSHPCGLLHSCTSSPFSQWNRWKNTGLPCSCCTKDSAFNKIFTVKSPLTLPRSINTLFKQITCFISNSDNSYLNFNITPITYRWLCCKMGTHQERARKLVCIWLPIDLAAILRPFFIHLLLCVVLPLLCSLLCSRRNIKLYVWIFTVN